MSIASSPAEQPSQGPTGRVLVAVPACRKFVDPHPFHGAGEKYLLALTDAAGVTPLVLPALGDDADWSTLLERIDGVFLTGSPSNVEPHHYRGAPSVEGTLHDPHRDATALPFIRAALEARLPLLAVCRGMQELNVVLGGSLHQRIQELPGMTDHRAAPELPLEEAYAPAHEIELVDGGMLHRLAGCERVAVNSLHAQGVDRLGDDAEVEATADDGLIEAFRIPDHPFALAVQWHPEWRVLENPFSHQIFRAFGEACRSHAGGAQRDLHRAMV